MASSAFDLLAKMPVCPRDWLVRLLTDFPSRLYGYLYDASLNF